MNKSKNPLIEVTYMYTVHFEIQKKYNVKLTASQLSAIPTPINALVGTVKLTCI